MGKRAAARAAAAGLPPEGGGGGGGGGRKRARRTEAAEPAATGAGTSQPEAGKAAGSTQRKQAPEEGKGGDGTVEQALLDLVAKLDGLEQAVSDYTADKQEAVFQGINDWVAGLEGLAGFKAELDADVPVELLARMDMGENPDGYVKGLLDHCLARNQQSKGRVEILKEFRAALDAGLEGDREEPGGA